MKVKLIILSLFTVLALSFTQVSAYYELYTHGYAYRIVGIDNSDLSAGYYIPLEYAMSSWNDGITDREIRVVASTSTLSSIIDLDYRKALDIDENLTFLFQHRYEYGALYKSLAQSTTFCCSNHQTTAFIIYINTYLTPDTDASHAQYVIAHEIGHAFGLDDFDSTYYQDHIMNGYCYTSVIAPCSAELTAVDTVWDH